MESNLQNAQKGEQKTKPRLVVRRTGLRGLGIGAAPVPSRTIRKHTEEALNERDPEIPYVRFEDGLHELVCSLMERQDRMNEELLLRMIDLQYRMDDIEADFSVMNGESPAGDRGAPQ